jgi:aspartate/methionine/tyrosine aminotransferase
MRNNIVAAGAEEIRYEIREIVEVAKQFEKLGIKISWENIGDPVSKGEKIPDWIKKIVQDAAGKDMTYAYSPTKGLEETREFLANLTNKRGGAKITKEDIIFFNGLGDAIGKVYGLLRKEARIIGPSPAYSTHSSSEAIHAGTIPITYTLDPKNKWYPDIEDLRKKVKYNPAISGINIINPNNPTGAVYPKEVMEGVVEIAKEFDLFVISDEIYANICYNKSKPGLLGDVIGDVCGLSMKGISKEVPWPGARCGWIEVYNADKDPVFRRYVKSILDDKMLEVCSTTLPQSVIPKIFSDLRYAEQHEKRNKIFEKRANLAYNALKDVPGINAQMANGAFYMTVVFEKKLTDKQKLSIDNKKVKEYVEKLVSAEGFALDKRFTYYLLGATGICVVPLTGFESKLHGFRITLLETEDKKFEWIFKTLAKSIGEYLKS